MKNKIINEWFEKADHDLSSAKIIYIHIPENSDVIGFHCQQAVEKYLKGYLSYLEIEFKKTHDLKYLINLISTKDETFDELYNNIVKLSDFAVNIRYPDIVINPSKDELKYYIEFAEKIHEIITTKIDLK